MKKIILCSIIACTITNNSMGMLRFAKMIRNTHTKKRFYHTNPEDKYEKIAKNILHGTLDRKRKNIPIIKIQHPESSPDISHEQTDNNSENTLQTQSLQFLQTQQLLNIVLSSGNAYDMCNHSVSNSISNSDSPL